MSSTVPPFTVLQDLAAPVKRGTFCCPPPVPISNLGVPTEKPTLSGQFVPLTPSLECGRGEKVPEPDLLIQSGERHAQLGSPKGPGRVQGPRGGQAAPSPGGINCG